MAEMRRCIGSERFGIEPHDAPIGDFPSQPSQKDGLGRMCKVHWNQYTAGLARDAKARKAFDGLSYSRKRSIVEAIDTAKSAETRERRVARSVEKLRTGRV